MSDLSTFVSRVKLVLDDADREPHWSREESRQYMAAFGERRKRFEQVANDLIEAIIRPRIGALAAFFPNAARSANDPVGCCSYWFGYCDRFPTSTKVELLVEHDARYETLIVRFSASMMPVFIQFRESDSLPLPLEQVDSAQVADWVEERLLEFLDDYLRIDRGSECFDEDTVTDPVCGMKFTRSTAAANESYYGNWYYFCSVDCYEKFHASPQLYVRPRAI